MTVEELVSRFTGDEVAIYRKEWRERTSWRNRNSTHVHCCIERTLAGEMRIVATPWYDIDNRCGRAAVLCVLYSDAQDRGVARNSKYLDEIIELGLKASKEEIDCATEFYDGRLFAEPRGYVPVTDIPYGHGNCYL